MSVTIKNCLKLPSLINASVVGGQSGLEKIATSVSVLEHSNPQVIEDSKHLFVGSEILITALVAIADDVDKQCRLFKCLHECGVVALILFYVGVFLPKVDDRLVVLSDELDLPLIIMPERHMGVRYGEVITEIAEAIFQDRIREDYFVPGLLERISQIPEEQRTVSYAMRMLSDRLHYNFALIDKDFRLLGTAAWPSADKWPVEQILVGLSNSFERSKFHSEYQISANDCTYYLSCHTVTEKNRSAKYLLAISKNEGILHNNVVQASDFLELFLNVWHYTDGNKSSSDLVRAILNDDTFEMRQIANKMKTDVKSINAMWLLKDRKNNTLTKMQASRALLCSRKFWDEHDTKAIVETFEGNVVMFFSGTEKRDILAYQENEYVECLGSNDESSALVCVYGLKNTHDVHDSYASLKKFWEAMLTVYPEKRVFNAQDIAFIKMCHKIIASNSLEAEQQIQVFEPIFSKQGNNDLVDTLCCFLLDSECNIGKTAEVMFVHRNTIKYRLGIIKEILGYDITKLPGMFSLYIAAAILRLSA